MKQINFKIEKNATESKVYIEFNSLIEYLRDASNFNMHIYNGWRRDASKETNRKKEKELINIAMEYMARSFELDQTTFEINKQFIEFTKQVNENGFS